MGIRGLTKYIADRSDYYLENYELYNTNLVIDGRSLVCQLFVSAKYINCAFGGDYDVFAHNVTRFFADLLRCNVTPLVIFDGGWEDKKYLTIIGRMKDRLRIAQNNASMIREKGVVYPSLLNEVFTNIVEKMNIKHLTCIYEADNAIAGLARVLNCPVLSYDSDFYIYGVMYIPYNTLDSYIVKSSEGYVKRCKIFKYKKLLNRFKGLDVTLLPLASILLGNDYIDRKIFCNFFGRLTRSKTKYSYITGQQKIEIVFNWLKNYTLNGALDQILNHLSSEKRAQVTEDINNIVNSYLNISTEILSLLGFNEHFIQNVEKNIEVFKYDEANKVITNNDDDAGEDIDDHDSNTTLKDTINEEKTLDEFSKLTETDIVHEFASFMPLWFMKNIYNAKYPPTFINILTHNVMMMRCQVENMSLPSADEISHPIITRICSLLFTLENKSDKNNSGHETIKLITRKDCNMATVNLNIPNEASVDLKMIEKYSFADRKQIIDKTLKITNEYNLEELPTSWRLYVASILYWIQMNDCVPIKTKIHLDCLLLAMLLGIFDEKIGPWRSRIKFNERFDERLKEIQNNKENNEVKAENLANDLMTLLVSVSENDCIVAIPFFIEHLEADSNLKKYPQKFLPEVVHVFSQFQSCLKYSMHLNALMDNVYEQPSVSNFFNGTFLYNLFNNLKTRVDINNYIATRLKDAPEILKIFQLLQYKVFKILNERGLKADDGKKNTRRKRKKNKKDKSIIADTDDKNCGDKDIEKQNLDSTFCDPNNRFARLTID